jgi:hypothetical protein
MLNPWIAGSFLIITVMDLHHLSCAKPYCMSVGDPSKEFSKVEDTRSFFPGSLTTAL